MNRLFTLKSVLPKNLETCRDFPNIEFILLDYNSTDGLSKWVKTELEDYIEIGLLKYYKIVDPVLKYFSHPHSRNVAFRLASGEFLYNANADYFIDLKSLVDIYSHMTVNDPVALIADVNKAEKDNFGRICFRKEDFYKVGGYDETFEGYGYEDTDLCLRLGIAGVNLKYMENRNPLKFVKHSDDTRILNMYDYKHIREIYYRKVEGGRTEVMYLFDNHKAEIGTLGKSNHDIPILCEKRWVVGNWRSRTGRLSIAFQDGTIKNFLKEEKGILRPVDSEDLHYLLLSDPDWIKKAILKKSQILNSQYMKERRINHQYKVNPTGYGVAVVQENFDSIIELKAEPESVFSKKNYQ